MERRRRGRDWLIGSVEEGMMRIEVMERQRVRVRLVAALNPLKTPTFGYSVSSSFERLGF